MNTHTPQVGDLVWDSGANKLGELMARTCDTVWLRPVRGGQEWTARAKHVRPATAAEQLSARVAEANARSRGTL